MAKKDSGNELRVLFPGKEVDLGNGYKVTVSPLTLEDMPKVVESFGKIIALSQDKAVDPARIAVVGMSELLHILPYCIDRPANEIPSTAVPEILEIVVEQNVTDAAVGKWTALVQKMLGALPGGVAKDQSGTTSQP